MRTTAVTGNTVLPDRNPLPTHISAASWIRRGRQQGSPRSHQNPIHALAAGDVPTATATMPPHMKPVKHHLDLPQGTR